MISWATLVKGVLISQSIQGVTDFQVQGRPGDSHKEGKTPRRPTTVQGMLAGNRLETNAGLPTSYLVI